MSIRTKLFTYGAVAAGVVYLLKSSRKTPAAIAHPVDDEAVVPVADEPTLSVVEAAPEVVEEKPAVPKKRKASTRRRRAKRVAA